MMSKKQHNVVSQFLQDKKPSRPLITGSNRLIGEAVLRSMELDGEFYGANRQPIISRDEQRQGFDGIVANAYSSSSQPLASRIAHADLVEAKFDFLTHILLRPLPLLAASIVGFLASLVYYLFVYFNHQKFYYQMILVALLIGYLLGWLIELINLATSKRPKF